MNMRFLIGLTAILFIFSLAVTSGPACAEKEQGSGLSIIKIAVSGREDVERISNMGMDIACYENGYVTIVATKQEVMQSFGRARTEIIMENADDMFKPFRGRSDCGVYHTYQESIDAMKAAAKKYPQITEYSVIGKSYENRDIACLKISDNAAIDEDEPESIFMGAHHAREWISVEIPLALMDTLLEGYNKDDRITNIVNSKEIFIVPVVNPDGLLYSQTEYKMWRKNRCENEGTTYMGVDLNRNYGYQWGNVGASSSPYSDTYHGPCGFSEPEARAMRDFEKKRNFVSSVSYHSYGQLILYPYGYGYDIYNPEEDIFKKMSHKMSTFNKYRPQNSAALYPAMGDHDDYAYGDQNILAFTIELGRQFVPRENLVQGICEKNVKACLWLIEEGQKHYPREKPEKYYRLPLESAFFEYRVIADELKDYSTDMATPDIIRSLTARRFLMNKIVKDSLSDSSSFKSFINHVELLNGSDSAVFNPVLKIMIENLASSPDVSEKKDMIKQLDSLLR